MSIFIEKKQREELIAVLLSLALALLKGSIAIWTGALSLLASALDSLLDFLVSSVNLFALVVSHKEADIDHSFGHEKAEALGGLFQSVILVLTAGFLIYSSIQRFYHPFELQHLEAGMGVIVFSIFVSFTISWRLKKAARQTGSIVLKSDAIHYAVDLYSYTAILIAFILIKFTAWNFWDPLMTLPIALYLVIQGLGIGKEAIDELMDRETSPEIRHKVHELILKHEPQVLGMHNFKSRRAAGKRFIQFHLEMKRHLSFEHVHDISEKITKEIRQELGNVHVIIHPDPEGHGEDESDL